MTGHRWRVLEAMVALGVIGVLLHVLPFAWIARLAGRVDAGTIDDEPRAPTPHAMALGVGRAVQRAATFLPWRPACLPRALAGGAMLRWRGVPTVLVLGVSATGGEIRAHAWLMAAGGAVCGGREAAGFTTIAAIRS